MKKDLMIVGLTIAYVFLFKFYAEQNKELRLTQSHLNSIVSQNINEYEDACRTGKNIKAIEWKKNHFKKQGDE